MVVASFSTIGEPHMRPSPSSLLEATPPSMVYALSTAYPMLALADRVLGWLTWTSSDRYESVLMVLIYMVLWRNFDTAVHYWLPVMLVSGLVLLAYNQTFPAQGPPTLEEIVKKLESSGKKYRQFIAPLDSLRMSGTEMVKLVLATLFFSPVYIVISHFWLTPRRLLFAMGVIILSWHSLWFKVARSLAWRFRSTRFLVFLVTGVDRTSDGRRNSKGDDGQYHKELKRSLSQSSLSGPNNVTFTFVVFENQRHWLGIGWTRNMLPEERAAWTDPSLNEVQSIDTFVLPDAEGTGMMWKWVDKDWKLDLTNAGLLAPQKLKNAKGEKPVTDIAKRDVTDNQGFVYTNNLWTSPATYAGFSKYTRRRRWIRKAALVPLDE